MKCRNYLGQVVSLLESEVEEQQQEEFGYVPISQRPEWTSVLKSIPLVFNDNGKCEQFTMYLWNALHNSTQVLLTWFSDGVHNPPLVELQKGQFADVAKMRRAQSRMQCGRRIFVTRQPPSQLRAPLERGTASIEITHTDSFLDCNNPRPASQSDFTRPAGGRPDCKVCSDRMTGKQKQTKWQCKTCQVSLCMYPCFERYHTLKHYK